MFKPIAAVVLALASTCAIAQRNLERRTGFIDCGKSQVRALAECYDNTGYCVTETLSFARRAGRTIVPVHPHQAVHGVRGKKLKALDFHAAAWACLPGRYGGHYVVVLMNRATGANCSDCEYSRLYDLNGRLVATDLDKSGRELMHEVLGGPGPHVFAPVYR